MDSQTIFLIGALVTLLFFAGIVLSIVEFRKMADRPDAYGPEADLPVPGTRAGREMREARS